METMPTLQEVFDMLVSVPASTEVLYADFEELTLKHLETMRTEGKTDAYYDDVKALADKFGLDFTHPKYAMGLKTVETRPTVH